MQAPYAEHIRQILEQAGYHTARTNLVRLATCQVTCLNAGELAGAFKVLLVSDAPSLTERAQETALAIQQTLTQAGEPSDVRDTGIVVGTLGQNA